MALIENINFGLFGSNQTDIDAIAGIIDLYSEENHNLPVTKTKYPVEDGSSRTDNIVVEPEQLVLKGLVSDLQTNPFSIVEISDKFRQKEAWGRLKELKNSGDLVTVITLLGMYENMSVINIDATVNRDSGHALFFTITLEETIIVDTEIIKLAPSKLTGPAETKGTETNGGQKQSEEPDPDAKTLLQEIISAISGVF